MTRKTALILAPFLALLCAAPHATTALASEKLWDLHHGLGEKETKSILQKHKPQRLEFAQGKLQALETALSPAMSLNTLPQVPLVEITKPSASDFQPGLRYLAHPATGRIWTVNSEGKLVALEVAPPWVPQGKAATWDKLLDREPPWNRPVRVKTKEARR